MRLYQATGFSLLFGLLSLAAVANEDLGNDKAVPKITRGTPAILIEDATPVYPWEMHRRGIEGWVQVGYVIGEDGYTRDIQVLDHSEDLGFDRAVITAVSKRKFQAATLDGKPVPETKFRERFVFVIRSADSSVSRKFKSRVATAYESMDEGDLEKARRVIDKAQKEKQYSLRESCWLDILEGDYWQKAGDDQQALKHFERALVIAIDFNSEASYRQLLRSSIVLNAKLGRLAAALDQLATLDEVEAGLPDNDPMKSVERKIRQFIDSDQPYSTDGEIAPPCDTCTSVEPTFYNKLLRDRVTVTDVRGSLENVQFLCGRSNVSVSYEPGMAWDINKDWGDCYLKLDGVPGTTFRIVEL